MANSWFSFKQFTIHQDRSAMKVTTDGCLFGAWVAEKLSKYETAGKARLLDIGTGTGLLPLMIAQKHSFEINAIEIDDDAYDQARENIASSPWFQQVRIWHGDARTFTFPNQYHIIVSNPPFYENELKSPDAGRNMAHHSEMMKLEELMKIIRAHLLPGGSFFLLLPYKRYSAISKLLGDQQFQAVNIVLVRPSASHEYFRVMIEGRAIGLEVANPMREEITIREDNGEYAPGFKSLLKEYYLYL